MTHGLADDHSSFPPPPPLPLRSTTGSGSDAIGELPRPLTALVGREGELAFSPGEFG